MKISPCRVVIFLFIREGISNGGLRISFSGFDASTVRTADSDSWAERRHYKD